MVRRRDFLEELIDERTKKNPQFPELVQSALERRQLMRELAAAREEAGMSQTVVAARMGTSQSAVARIETGEADVRLSTADRFAAAVGKRLTWTLGVPQRAGRRTSDQHLSHKTSAAKKTTARPKTKRRAVAR